MAKSCRIFHAVNAETVIREVQEFQKVVEGNLQLDRGSVVPPGASFAYVALELGGSLHSCVICSCIRMFRALPGDHRGHELGGSLHHQV